MLERYNPILRIVCLALAGLILYQISRLAFQKDAVARPRIEAPVARIESTNKTKVETNAPAASTNSTASPTNVIAGKTNVPGPGAAAMPRMAGPRRGPGGA